ncbi:lactococcin 972 family bacteriocin [Corynebacterium sp. 3HC-13]|nr:lactococcin 972 family bacteriocin [Corynebacterium poyangense]MBZ8176411.1 lactococcin 972 family bacteriocin [Corynebacterium poyangense]
MTGAMGVATAQERSGKELPVESIVLTRDENGKPTSGYVIIPLGDPSSSDGISVRKVPYLPGTNHEKTPTGGDWTYGWHTIGGTGKECFSNYMHSSKSHTASVTMGEDTNKSTSRAGGWAKASVRGGLLSGSCQVFWSDD